ncbi:MULTISPECIES: UbiA family prenyltransferase [Haloferax]|uniref:UbiA family prenyltransferase n=1 Tax=Haloferax TaxID=2251 RepID=UPI002377DDC4|nr:UbiA family prenyltransferase [Haloferax mediterranei]MDX5989873.1 UbiA family prenyltransferase [Haloferax mediterranei ATCC 33500]
MCAYLLQFVSANRLPETIGYNIVYFAIGVGLVSQPQLQLTSHQFHQLGLVFLAVMLTKMQASIADVIHDYTIDKANPEKSHLAAAVDTISVEILWSVLIVELTGGLVLWGWLGIEAETPFFLLVGAVNTILGFTYSYPPRLKERGIINHLVTTGVDVAGVILPVAVIAGADIDSQVMVPLTIVLLYVFGYHVVHQAADTAYDRKSGVETLTQSLGVTTSVWVASFATTLAAVLAASQQYVIATTGLVTGSLGYAALAVTIRGESEEAQCRRLSRWFRIGVWATLLNGTLAASLFI